MSGDLGTVRAWQAFARGVAEQASRQAGVTAGNGNLKIKKEFEELEKYLVAPEKKGIESQGEK